VVRLAGAWFSQPYRFRAKGATLPRFAVSQLKRRGAWPQQKTLQPCLKSQSLCSRSASTGQQHARAEVGYSTRSYLACGSATPGGQCAARIHQRKGEQLRENPPAPAN